MDGKICIEEIKNTGDALLEQLEKGNMIVGAAQQEILYLIDSGSRYDVFVHIPGTPEGRRNSFPKDERSPALIRNLCKLADSLYAVEYDKSLDLNGVLVAAERAVISIQPQEKVEFVVPGKKEETQPEAGENPQD